LKKETKPSCNACKEDERQERNSGGTQGDRLGIKRWKKPIKVKKVGV